MAEFAHGAGRRQTTKADYRTVAVVVPNRIFGSTTAPVLVFFCGLLTTPPATCLAFTIQRFRLFGINSYIFRRRKVKPLRPQQLPPVPVGAALLNPPHLDALEGPLGADRHVDVAVPVGVVALAGGRAFGSHRPAGVEDPLFGCRRRKKKKKKKRVTQKLTDAASGAQLLHLRLSHIYLETLSGLIKTFYCDKRFTVCRPGF